MNNKYENYGNIENINVEYDPPISDNIETRIHKHFKPYRRIVVGLIKRFLIKKNYNLKKLTLEKGQQI